MQIAIIRRKFNPFGGAERFILRTIEGLKNHQIKTSIIAESWQTPKKGDFIESASEWIPVKVKGYSRFNQLKSFQNSVSATLKMHSFDLIQSHERLLGVDIYRLGDGIHASWLKRFAQHKPWHQKLWLKLDPFHRLIIATEKKMAQDEKLIFVANSLLVKHELMDWYKVPEERIVIIENGINTQEFTPATPTEKNNYKASLSLSTKQPLVLFIGSGFERKGAFHLVQAIAGIDDFQAVIVGHDKRLKQLKNLCRTLHIENRVHIVGPKDDVKPYLKAADIFCLPSIYDSLPNALLEALCSGLPVVVSNGVGIADKVLRHGAGVVCDINPKSISLGILDAWNNKETFSNNALRLSKEFDIQIKSEAWLKLYNQMIQKKKTLSNAHSSY
jgi:UDP-glucose:(heptosyl)LPS alpha-1,3-glucosyltransferase